MIVIPVLLFVWLIFALTRGIGLVDLITNILEKAFVLLMYLMLAALIFIISYFVMNAVGIRRGVIDLSVITAVVGALFVFHKTEDQ